MSTRSARRRRSIRPLCAALLTLCAAPVWAQSASVLTQHNDNARTGSNTHETILTPATVNQAAFGKLFTITLDADVNGQVLYVPGVTINGGVHNVIYAFTSNNINGSPCSLWAWDADQAQANPLWHTTLTNSAQWTTDTPVIDPSTNTLYVVTKDNSDSGATHLRAFDITTGREKSGSPITIAASVSGTGDGSSGGVVSFDTSHGNERPGLLLLNGVVYIAFAHNSDSFPYHGWVMGYKFTQPTGTTAGHFTQTAVFCADPNGGEAGIWASGQGLAADPSGNIYFSTGNGTFDAYQASAPNTDYGMCYVKLGTPNLNVVDWFAPFDESGWSNQDLDLGNSGPLLIPGTNRLFGGGTKFGSVFLLDSTNLGHFVSGGPDNDIQRLDNVMSHDNVGQNPIAYDSGGYKYVYLWPVGSDIQQYRYDPNAHDPNKRVQGEFNPAGIYKTTQSLTSGGSLAVTSNGGASPIAWAIDNSNAFRAFSALDVSATELWDSNQVSSRDALPAPGHFQFPTVVNGKAYVPTGANSIAVYGLLHSGTQALIDTADAYVEAGAGADTNYGSLPQLSIKRKTNDGTSTYNRAVYLRFDLTNVTTAPKAATLVLSVNAASNPSNKSETVNVYAVPNTSWSEGSITWNNAPGLDRANFTSTGTQVAAQSVPLTAATVTFDLTSFVAAHLGKTVTLQLIDPVTDDLYLDINSRQVTTGKPELVLTN